jgi:membrane fusion protein, heavy metal efflux system
MWRLLLALVLTIPLVGAGGCRPQPQAAAQPAASGEKKKEESDLAYVTLSKKAYKAVAIQTAPLKSQVVQERLTLTGWIMAKPGYEVTVTAPAAGYVRLAKDHKRAPTAGERVSADQDLLVLEPVLTPVDQIQLAALKRGVEGELAKAKTSLQTATTEYERVRELHAKNLRSQQDLDQAQRALEHAKEDQAAAQDKLKLFVTANVPLRAPRAGSVLALHASPGQYVAAAAPVVTIIDMQPVWLRVPVPEFDLPHIDVKQDVAITLKNSNGSASAPAKAFTARPAGRVAQVDALRHTADFWYELTPAKDAPDFYKDQMVTVYMPLGVKRTEKLVPHDALVYDTHGNAWLYLERTKADDKLHRFVRQRVQLGAPVGAQLIVRAELSEGDRVVTRGAAVLFSREFHKTPVAEDDDD